MITDPLHQGHHHNDITEQQRQDPKDFQREKTDQVQRIRNINDFRLQRQLEARKQ